MVKHSATTPPPHPSRVKANRPAPSADGRRALGTIGVWLAFVASLAGAVVMAVGLGAPARRAVAARGRVGGRHVRARRSACSPRRAAGGACWPRAPWSTRWSRTTSRSSSWPRTTAPVTPLLYSITGLWSALAGSILLWGLDPRRLHQPSSSGATGARSRDPVIRWATLVLYAVAAFFFGLMVGPGQPVRHGARRARRGSGRTRCCRTTRWWPSTHPSSTWASSGSPCPSPSPSACWRPAGSATAGRSSAGAGRWSPSPSSRSGSCSAPGGPTRCSGGAASGAGTRSRTPPSCPGSAARRTCTRSSSRSGAG